MQSKDDFDDKVPKSKVDNAKDQQEKQEDNKDPTLSGPEGVSLQQSMASDPG